MIAKLLRHVADHAKKGEDAPAATGLERDHPLLRFFTEGGATLGNYLALDDVVITAALERMQRASDPGIADLAIRLWHRRLYKTLDLRAFGHDEGRQRRAARRIDKAFEAQRERKAVSGAHPFHFVGRVEVFRCFWSLFLLCSLHVRGNPSRRQAKNDSLLQNKLIDGEAHDASVGRRSREGSSSE